MSACNNNNVRCSNVQLLEPDDEVLTVTSSGSTDASLSERGEVALSEGQGIASVSFLVPKAGEYRFEYLYVDTSSSPFDQVNPGAVVPVVNIQTIYGFAVDFAGAPVAEGYTLRWRVTVVTTPIAITDIDKPESLRIQLDQDALTQEIAFLNPRSGTVYGFSELRVENLDDDPVDQSPILAQVVAKEIGGFTVALSPPPDTGNYYLVVRTP